jgi:dihydrodipicolinate synthase/N-acetylneuraminate lyase
MDRTSIDWKGYFPAVTTPFTADGELDLAGFAELLEWLLAEGMHGLAIAGTSGEWFSLTATERCDLFRTAARQVRGRVPLLAGCNAFRTDESIEFAEFARELDFDGILLAPPPYAVPSEDDIAAHYQRVSDRVAVPICLYNFPARVGVDLTAPVVERLADIEHVVAIKNSTGDYLAFAKTFYAVKDRIRVFGFGNDELSMTLITAAGGDGTIGGGGVLGADHPNFYNHLWAGDLDSARACAARDSGLSQRWLTSEYAGTYGSAHAILKAALNVRGLPGGYPRFPLLPLDQAGVERVRADLAEFGVPAAA